MKSVIAFETLVFERKKNRREVDKLKQKKKKRNKFQVGSNKFFMASRNVLGLSLWVFRQF